MSNKLQYLILSLILTSQILYGCSSGEEEETSEIIRPVRYQKAQLSDGMIKRMFSGISEARVESSLSFKVGGTVEKRSVSVGDELKSGQLIALLDSTDFNITMHDAEASLANAQAELRRARSNYDRAKTLYENNNTSKNDLDSARAAAESASAQVESAGQKLRSARLQLSYTKLYSPGNCAVASTHVKENENISAGSPIVTVNCGDCADVKMSVPGNFINSVKAGNEVEVEFDAFPTRSFRAIVTEVGVSSSGTATAFPVTVALQEGCAEIRAGMAADVSFSIPVTNNQNTIVIPPVAATEDRIGRFVFVLEQNSDKRWFAKRRPVEIGELTPTGLIVTKGIEADELIVTAGVSRIVDGQEVKLLEGMD